MSTRHTPGPWRRVQIIAGSGKYAGHIGIVPGGHHLNPPLAYLAKGRAETQEANASVIAASPRMLAALVELVATKELHDQLETLRPLPPEREEEYRQRRVAAWAEARAAVEDALKR